MTQREAAIQQLKALKGKPLKKKLRYLFTYYWLHAVCIVAVIVCLISYVSHLATQKETVLNITCINAPASRDGADRFAAEFAQAVGIDPEEQEIVLSTDLMISAEGSAQYDAEVLAAQIMAGSVDLLVGEEDVVLPWSYQEIFADLSLVLTKEQQTTEVTPFVRQYDILSNKWGAVQFCYVCLC